MRLITAPTLNAVTVTEAKIQLEIPASFTDRDDYILMLIQAAERTLEERTNIAFLTQVREEYFDNWGWYRTNDLVSYPFQGDLSVKYYDQDNAEQTLDSESYLVHHDRGTSVEILSGISLPSLYERRGAVKIRYTAGWTSADLVPSDLKLAILKKIAQLYDDRLDRPGSEAFTFKNVPGAAERMVLNHMQRYV